MAPGARTAVLVLACAVLALAPAATLADDGQPPLRQLAPPQLAVGTGVKGYALSSDADYAAKLASEYTQVTPENEMKWDATEPSRDDFDFSRGDAVVDYAESNGLAVHGHTLVWNEQLPSWLTGGHWRKRELITIMKNHIQTVMRHYKGRVRSWDVVNEAIGVKSIWSQVIGYPDYVKLAFQFAHEADPDARLFYNEINADGVSGKSRSMYKLMSSLKRQLPGVPLGVGLQMHVSLCAPLGARCPPSAADVERNMKRFSDLGMDVDVSEMDVRLEDGENGSGPTPEALDKQADVYRGILKACLDVSRCRTTWGFTDRFSWIPGKYDGYGYALPFDANLQPKPAFDALCEALGGSSCSPSPPPSG